MIPGVTAGGFLHRALDRFAIWTEDRVSRAPEPLRLGMPAPLDCFGPVPRLDGAPPARGRWSVRSPRPAHPGDRLWLRAAPAIGPRRGTALLVPPWKIRHPRIVGGYVRLLRTAGLDTWLLSPPHHLERVIAGGRSGEGFVSLDVARLRAVVEQLVVEIRACAMLAAERGPVVLVGLSLGGLGAALAATAGEPVASAALIAPPDLRLTLSETGIGRRYRELSARAGSPWPGGDALEAALAPFDPALRRPTASRLLVAAGRHDVIAPPAGAVRLARAWGIEPAVYPRGHLSLIFLCNRLRADLRRFLMVG